MIEAFNAILDELHAEYAKTIDKTDNLSVKALYDGKILAIKEMKLKLEVFQAAKNLGFEVGTTVAKRNGENFNHGGLWKNIKNIRFDTETLHILVELDGEEKLILSELEVVKQ